MCFLLRNERRQHDTPCEADLRERGLLDPEKKAGGQARSTRCRREGGPDSQRSGRHQGEDPGGLPAPGWDEPLPEWWVGGLVLKGTELKPSAC